MTDPRPIPTPPMADDATTATPMREPAGGMLAAAVIAILLLAVPAALVHDLAGTLVLGGGLALLAWNRRENSADVVGLFLVAFCAAPFLRRIHDLRLGWNAFSVLLISPYILFLPLLTGVVKNLPRLRRPTLIPIVLVLAGLLWAFLVGVWNLGPTSAVIGAVEWFSGPLIFCFMALSGKKVDYQRLGNWVTPLMAVEAVYGLYQWAKPPLWDAKWLVDSNMTTSMGQPLPFLMRTFGTLNSTGTFAFVCVFYLVAGLNWKKYGPVSILVIAALATSMVRAAWFTSVLGIGLAVLLQGGKERRLLVRRLALIGLVLVLAGIPFLGRFQSVADRFMTVGNLGGDNSFNERAALAEIAMRWVIDTPEGAGLGAIGRGAKVTKQGLAGMDNGFIALSYMLGWASATLYLGGFLAVCLWSIAVGDPRRPERAAMGGLVLVLFASNAFGISFSDIGGVICWTSAGILYLACLPEPSPEPTLASAP